MAGSLIDRLRARLEELQKELAPEAGFDRRAYGYEDGAGVGDTTFEDVEREDEDEDESPWRRPGDDPPRPEPEPEPVRGPVSRGPGTPRPRAAPARGSAAARPEASDPFGSFPGPSGGGLRRDAPAPPRREAPAPARSAGAPTAGVGSAPRARSRSRRLRARLRQTESLRDLFLLREVIDRPVALRRRPPGRSRGRAGN